MGSASSRASGSCRRPATSCSAGSGRPTSTAPGATSTSASSGTARDLRRSRRWNRARWRPTRNSAVGRSRMRTPAPATPSRSPPTLGRVPPSTAPWRRSPRTTPTRTSATTLRSATPSTLDGSRRKRVYNRGRHARAQYRPASSAITVRAADAARQPRARARSDRGASLLVRRPRRGEVVAMTGEAIVDGQHKEAGGTRLSLLLAAAMFVLVVDTSLMNVSISAVVEDLDTKVSSVQSAIALEALVSAAFILINSKIGDLFGRKRAYVLGLLGYAIGAVAMTLAQSLTAIIIFWAIIGGLGASLLLPAMQSRIHGNFEGAARKKTYALVGAAAAIAAAVGPLLGGFVTTFLSWRVGFLLEVVVIAVVLVNIRMVRDVAYTGPRHVDLVGAALSVVGMGGVVLGILVWQEGGEAVGALIAAGLVGLAALGYWLVRRKRQGKPTLIDPDLFRLPHFRIGVTQQMLQQVTLGGAMIVLPLFLQMTLEYNAMEA